MDRDHIKSLVIECTYYPMEWWSPDMYMIEYRNGRLVVQLDRMCVNTIPSAVRNLRYLTTVELSGSRDTYKWLEVDLSMFKHCNNLTVMRIRTVTITDENVEFNNSLTSISIDRCILRHLNISSIVNTLPNTVIDMELACIDVSHDESDCLDGLNNLYRLKELSLIDLSIDLPRMLDGLYNLERLEIDRCIDVNMCGLSWLFALDHLVITKCKLTRIPESIYKLTQLKSIDLSNNKIDEVRDLSRLLKNIPNLTEVNMNDNMLCGDIDLLYMDDDVPNLRYLYLNNNNLYGTLHEYILDRMPNIRSVCLWNNNRDLDCILSSYKRIIYGVPTQID